jgi:hypothetical protein
VPGCWAERYGSRAPEWRSKVSTINMLIKKTWALVAPNSPTELLVSDDLKIIKFVQLMMSKSITLSIKESVGLPTRIETDLLKKVKLVHKLITAESVNIEALCLSKQQEWYQAELLDSVNDFFNIVGLADEFVNAAYLIERKNLLRFCDYCENHRTFVFQLLYDLNYSNEYLHIKETIDSALRTLDNDSKRVFHDLNIELLKSLKHE